MKGTFHKESVVGIAVDGERKRLYSIGEDKMLHVICLEKKVVLCSKFINF